MCKCQNRKQEVDWQFRLRADAEPASLHRIALQDDEQWILGNKLVLRGVALTVSVSHWDPDFSPACCSVISVLSLRAGQRSLLLFAPGLRFQLTQIMLHLLAWHRPSVRESLACIPTGCSMDVIKANDGGWGWGGSLYIIETRCLPKATLSANKAFKEVFFVLSGRLYISHLNALLVSGRTN